MLKKAVAPVLALAAVLAILTGIFSPAFPRPGKPSSPAPKPAPPPVYDRRGWPDHLTIAYITIGNEAETLARYASLNDFLASRLGLKIRPVVTNGYLPVYVGFQLKRMDVSYLGPISYVKLKEKLPVEPAVMELTPDGQAGYYAYLIARADSGLKRLDDAKGKTLAFVDKESTSGFLIPAYYFLQVRKQTPGSFAGKVVFAGTHENVIAGVLGGQYDFGATDDIDFERYLREHQLQKSRFVILWKSEKYPAPLYAIRQDLPPTLRRAFRDSMLAVNQQPKILSDLGIGGLVKADDAAYNKVRSLRSLVE
jgi:phosphonate transport system substrate-binding protein